MASFLPCYWDTLHYIDRYRQAEKQRFACEALGKLPVVAGEFS